MVYGYNEKKNDYCLGQPWIPKELCCIAGTRMMSRAGDENDNEAAAAPATVVKEAASCCGTSASLMGDY